ncbi:MAG: DinB family protein [Saprospiraceae bacterium]|jgi:uncharacterized damage-inducible protein DinB
MENYPLYTMLVREAHRRLLDESLPRLKRCLDLLDEEEIWLRPNASSNSVGNLVLHVCGNARQWIVAGLGGAVDTRRRSEEFSARGPLPKTYLIGLLDALAPEMEAVLDKLSEGDIRKGYSVQGFQETGVGILIHVTEHFSYHVGQVSYFVKARKNLDLGYYSGLDLEKK